ncbi:MAG: hypothetical protein JJT96_14280, partial [Opitutales bacterium]|nr:hypothetical protein [Opitutales bacterium]
GLLFAGVPANRRDFRSRPASAVDRLRAPRPQKSAATLPTLSGDESAGLLFAGVPANRRDFRSRPASAVDPSRAPLVARRFPTSAAAPPSPSGDKSAGLLFNFEGHS